MKYVRMLISALIIVAILSISYTKVEAASAEISGPNKTVEEGESVTITVKFIAAAWNLKVSGNGIKGESYASQTSDLTEAETEKTFKLDTSKAGTYTISLKGDITDKDGKTIDINKSCKVTVNAKKVEVQKPSTEPEKPATTTPSTPTTPSEPTVTEKPKVEEKPNFTEVTKKMYAENDINLRDSWSTSSKATKIQKGTELTVTATSNNKVKGYVWYRVSYNGQTKYVASNLISTTKPAEEKPIEEPKAEKPEVEMPEETTNIADEPEKNTETKGEQKGLKKLEIEGIKLSTEFKTDTYNYEAVLKENKEEIKINAETINDDETVVIAGDKNIQEGENLITIIVYNAKNEAVATYQIALNKNTLDLSSTDELLKCGNQAAILKTTIYMVGILLATIIFITVLIVKYNTQNKQEEKEEKQEKFARDEEKKGKHF